MTRYTGTTVRGVRAPIFKEGDDAAEIITSTIVDFLEGEDIAPADKDVLSITESVVARAQGNYVTVDQIAADIKNKYPDETVGLVFPILSRNRFAMILKGIARGVREKVVIMLSYPADEVGNHLVYISRLDEKKVNPWTDVLSEKEFRDNFGYEKHIFTGIDYIEYYKEIVESEGKTCEFVFSNNPLTILDYTSSVLACDVHSRERTISRLKKANVEKIYSLTDIMTKSVGGSGFNPEYGLLGSNKATEERLKLFPRDCNTLVRKIQSNLLEKTGSKIEVMVYGDGAFKDPVGKIWELADPVVSPGFTDGLEGTPDEIKLKYIADNLYPDLEGEELHAAVTKYIENRSENGAGEKESQGTTPRKLTDLLGSLSDLTSGSGDKGTPIVYIQGYFDSFVD